jgi:hypothetical protein
MLKPFEQSFIPTGARGIPNFDRYSALAQNWRYSSELLSKLRGGLAAPLSENVECIALAGSFGRFEGSSSSDADYIFVVHDLSHPKISNDLEVINRTIAEFGVSPPNKSGVFAKARTRQELIERVGRPNEDTDVLGKRLLLLLESRPIYGDDAYIDLLKDVFTRYTRYHEGEPTKEFAFLLNDLIRYFRYICVNYESNFWRENEKWALRNLKLRHSRVLMYSGLLFMLGEASRSSYDDKIDVVWQSLPLTPLERIARVYAANGDVSFFRVAGLYNVFLSHLSNEEVRKQLGPIEYPDRYSVPAFAELKANSDAFVAELLRFVLGRRGEWSERFFEYLIF